MAEPSSTAAAAAGASMAPVAGTALAATAAASALGVEYMHIVAGIAGGVVSLWFVPDIRAARAWIAIVAGTALAAFGGPVAGPVLSGWSGSPQGPAGNLAALLLGTFATDLLAGGRGVMRALPEWIFERATGRRLESDDCGTCSHEITARGADGRDVKSCAVRDEMKAGCDLYRRAPRNPGKGGRP